MSVPCKADTHNGSGSANDSSLLAILHMGGGYPGTIPQGCRRVLFPLRRYRQIHKVARGHPCGQYHPGCCCCLPQSIICRFGVPSRIIMDNGTQFKSRLFQEYCEGISTQLCFASVAQPMSNGQAERANAEILRGPKTRTYDCLKSMVQIGSTSFRAYYGGIGPHPAELPGRPRSSWSTGLKPVFPRKSLWACHVSSLSMNLCRNNYGVRTWTSSTNVDGERRSEMHGTTKRSSATTSGLCIVGSSGSMT
jgi:hypothetical protein